MRHWTHDELHALMEGDPVLKARSDKVHALPHATSEERELGKFQMMEIYADAVNCKQADTAKEYVKKVFECLRDGKDWDEIEGEYASQKLCHSLKGNDYICFCGNGV